MSFKSLTAKCPTLQSVNDMSFNVLVGGCVNIFNADSLLFLHKQQNPFALLQVWDHHPSRRHGQRHLLVVLDEGMQQDHVYGAGVGSFLEERKIEQNQEPKSGRVSKAEEGFKGGDDGSGWRFASSGEAVVVVGVEEDEAFAEACGTEAVCRGGGMAGLLLLLASLAFLFHLIFEFLLLLFVVILHIAVSSHL
ncbi:hypothetical protein LR48_Vigan06g119600 [Vigna angularis]|uniref:Uncharacterized protein n=1 Tax=Phaseolus angularis TaxID=3914 RepID=A0A0L9USN4_PHAAN|nr:hypothetical protein LR48_Vigan06g119600 [Vigna angularis]